MSETCALCWADHDWDSACAPAPQSEKNELASPVFEAKYPAGCAECGSHISVGERVGYDIDSLLCHERCPS